MKFWFSLPNLGVRNWPFMRQINPVDAFRNINMYPFSVEFNSTRISNLYFKYESKKSKYTYVIVIQIIVK
jgi:hypothetical protein